MQQSLKDRAECVPYCRTASAALELELRLNLCPEFLWHDRLVLARMNFVLVFHLADVDDVGEQLLEARLVKRSSASHGAFSRGPALVAPAEPLDLSGQPRKAFALEVHLEDLPNTIRFFGHEH